MALTKPAVGASLFGAVSFGVLISLTFQLTRRVSELVPEPYLVSLAKRDSVATRSNNDPG